MVSNSELSRLFSIFAELLLLHDKNVRLAGLLPGAAYRLKRMNAEVMEVAVKELAAQFRPQVAGIIRELKNTGTISALDELITLTPPGLFEMVSIRGLGGKKLSSLWKVAKIDTIEGLHDAARSGKLRNVPGFGAKTEQNILKAIETYNVSRDRFHYATVADSADALVKQMQKVFSTKLVSLCGEVRRQTLTVEGIEIIAAVPALKFRSAALRKSLVALTSAKGISHAHTFDEIPVTIYHTTQKKFTGELFIRTGSAAHVEKVMAKIKSDGAFASEEAIYKKASLPFIVPEMREDLAEWNFKSKTPRLVTHDDIKGVVHNHTTWSDGVDSLPDFVNGCKTRGYEYVVIADHSRNAHYAGGLKEERALQQLKAINDLNKKLKGFRIFKGIECDILVSGELDYGRDLLKQYEVVIVSVHQLLKMDESKATKRLIQAIENPFTTILGHMTGRKLLLRPGYPVNAKKVIDACAANNVIIEINANPYRLDMDWTHIPYAIKKGVMISIDPDAHSIAEIDNIRWGVSAARKGGLTTDMTWNAMPASGVVKWLKENRK
ncbi:DNA polymerase/3'-5' exonuclease PolX [Flavihumibacter solisilvae]|uniref:DNA polymerase/3'-5' exonuclease PolX n=1 Tax=Flavihumibacter solisilvae TaxID=1349421 RepID=UPI000690A6C7|nr:DNA polymerase/3'-5' exonuclease PolX [Flavihumibacter solisilvae]